MKRQYFPTIFIYAIKTFPPYLILQIELLKLCPFKSLAKPYHISHNDVSDRIRD